MALEVQKPTEKKKSCI